MLSHLFVSAHMLVDGQTKCWWSRGTEVTGAADLELGISRFPGHPVRIWGGDFVDLVCCELESPRISLVLCKNKKSVACTVLFVLTPANCCYMYYHTRPCAYQWFQGCACKVCETHRLKVKWPKRTGYRSTAIVTQLCFSRCMTSQWRNHSDYCCNHSDHFITIGHQQ